MANIYLDIYLYICLAIYKSMICMKSLSSLTKICTFESMALNCKGGKYH